MKHAITSTLLTALLLAPLAALHADDATKPNIPPKGEPTNATEAAAQKAKADALIDERYQALVAKMPPDQQAWERVLQENLGGFYLPHHKREKVAGASNAWDFVQDDPKLPRVLLIGDSVSRGYTQAVRRALAGKANVHRAPANCGPTATGLKKMDVWLGDGKWDVIHFNFGIHDRAALPLAPFQQLPHGSPHDLAFYSHSGELRAYADIPKTGPIPEVQQRELIHGYAACVSYIDAQVGLLMQTLAECGVADNTIVCFWGDHGWHLGEHGHWGKLTNYEDAARAPLIISAPGVPGGKRVTALTEFLDVYPTLCELAGLPISPHVEGKSLVSLMRGEDVTLRKAALTQMSHGRGKNGTMGWSIRTPRYRYIEWRAADFSADKPVFSKHVQATELYDYETDPQERENLARKADHAALVKQHQILFDQLLPHLPARS